MVKFGELPPTTRRSSYDHEGVAKALKERPDQWAECFEGLTHGVASSMVSNIRKGRISHYRDGTFEATLRRSEGEEGDEAVWSVWARFLKPPEKKSGKKKK